MYKRQVSNAGCSCHGTTPSDSVTASIEGLPDSYNYSEEYELTLSFLGGPSNPNNINQGGFNLWASHGTLSVVDGTAQISVNDGSATHTEAGNDQTSWTVKWTAPSADRNVDLVLHVTSVNGNAGTDQGAQGDEWNRVVAKISGPVTVIEAAAVSYTHLTLPTKAEV